MREHDLTPAMRQWQRVKDQHPDKLVLFRMGDFYELFGEDARTASSVLEIALTTRDKNKADPMPMCGVPYHALEVYLGRLLRSGFRVALCDQVEDAALAKGIVRREVTRVVTPGTVLEEGVVEADEPVLLASWNASGDWVGLAWADLSSGESVLWRSERQEAEERLKALAPAEILYPEGGALPPELARAVATPRPAKCFSASSAAEQLARKYGLPGELPGIPSDPEPLGALMALLDYVSDQGSQTLKLPRYETSGTFLAMDEATRRNLELVANLEDGGRRGTLLEALDETLTPMGARLLKAWVLTPCSDAVEIAARQRTVSGWLEEPGRLQTFRGLLKGMPDLARLVARFGAGLASPRDAGALRAALSRLPEAAELCGPVGERIQKLAGAVPQARAWTERLQRDLEGTLPHRADGGGIFAKGFDRELDRLRELAENAHGAILTVEQRERERAGIPSLKVKYNKVFGYFLEVSKANLAKVPADFERRQTLVNAERFVTQELRELESRILSARAEREALESQLWAQLQSDLQGDLAAFRDAAADLARADLLAGFAFQARQRGYCRPEILEEPRIDLEESRHPVLELDRRHQPFVPNPAHLDTGENQVLLLTGPNMGGKSTYLRQVALHTVMAHLGAWVPARRAAVGLGDRLFCRVGAGDSLLRGLSTFMVEMTETAAILRSATRRSLVLLDEVGRGTSTYDGLAIAWAVVEALSAPRGVGCRTLFATHYHELTELGRSQPGVKNLTMGVREYGGKVHFLRTVEEGAADRSYGIHVAELAGIPSDVVCRAREILQELEKRRAQVGLEHPDPLRPRQPNLFFGSEEGGDARDREVAETLRGLELEKLTPMDAILLIDRLKKKLSK
jgi:DNA mismatch repair protein MutS